MYEEFDRFIKCFYKDFRTLTIYESADIITKRRIETIMLNSLNLDDESFIILLDKENLFDKSFDLDEGFEYFFKARTISRGGGVAILINNELQCESIDDEQFFIEGILETITCKIIIAS